MTTPTQPESNDYAIASLVLGILSLAGMGPLTGIPAIITGWIALQKNQQNRGMAIAGIVTGLISIIFVVLLVLFFILLLVVGGFAASSFEANPGFFENNGTQPDSSQYQQRT